VRDDMTTFLRLLADKDKQNALASAIRSGGDSVFEVDPTSFCQVPGAPFAYWVSEPVREVFRRLPAFENSERSARQGLATADDFRFVWDWWEVLSNRWFSLAKGGAYSPYYADVHLVVNWSSDGDELATFAGSVVRNPDYYFRPGLTWPRRTSSGISLRALPANCIFADKGPVAFVANDEPEELLALLAVSNSRPFSILVELQLAAADAAARSYEVGVVQKTPIPNLNLEQQALLAALARRAWALKRTRETVEESSHAFLLPAALRVRLGHYDQPTIDAELARIQTQIDATTFDLYGFNDADRAGVQTKPCAANEIDTESSIDEDDEDDTAAPIDQTASLLSWAVGVVIGRFDWRLANGERTAPPDPDPFDPLPPKSPGMLPDGATSFHAHSGILVDDQGHPHDLAHLVEEVLGRVEMPVPDDVRRWLQRDFFAFHLQRYSKSRRKAPIYWPLATVSGSYTLWLYYPSLSSQTLYTAINDFVEPKLKEVGAGGTALRNKGSARTRDEEKQFETLQAFELELTELRDTLLGIAQGYQPNHDDGVQITAAPLWPLFRHKPWQKVLKDTWAKLEKGDYDWAHLAMSYWPARVREKCKADKSLAIAHGLEALYVEPEAKPKKTRGKKSAGEIE